jgi:uncharacterized membrane protein HdeD (DUF308 family)
MSDSRAVPLGAALLALLWLLVQLLNSAYLATAAAVAVIAATLALAFQRRQDRALPWLVAGIVLILAALLVGLLYTDRQAGLYLQLALIVILAPLVPLVYAFTFEPDADNDEAP